MGKLQQVRGRGTAPGSPRLQSPRDTTQLLGRHCEVSWDGLWALCTPKRGRECPSVTQGQCASAGRGQAWAPLPLQWGPSQAWSPSEQRPEMEFAAVELGDTAILSEADRQLLIHLLCPSWRKEIGVGEPLKPGSRALLLWDGGWRGQVCPSLLQVGICSTISCTLG